MVQQTGGDWLPKPGSEYPVQGDQEQLYFIISLWQALNKLASLEATLVRNSAHWLTRSQG